MKRLAWLAFLVLTAAPPAFGQSVLGQSTPGQSISGQSIRPAPKVAARLVADHVSAAPGGHIRVALVEDISPGWHTYWINPGDAGEPTRIGWRLPPGWSAGPIAWPAPKRLPVGPLMDYGYEGTLWLVSDLTVPETAKPGETVTIGAAVSWLVCKDICIPEDATLALPVKVGISAPDATVAGDFAAAQSRLPVASPWAVAYRLGTSLDLFVAAPGVAAARPVDAAFFPLDSGVVKGAAPQRLGFSPQGLVLHLSPGAKAGAGPLRGVLVLASADGSRQAISVTAQPGAVPASEIAADAPALGLVLALLFAFLGGLILNVMPCVLPVLAMKTLALATHNSLGPRAARHEGIAYAAGAIGSFLVFGLAILLLRQSGAAIGWGFQMQDPRAVAGFALLVFAVGLNLSGVFDFGSIAVGEQLARRAGPVGAFFTGVLAVAVAAPCTAPFMAAALGAALAGPALDGLGVFFALGLGFALPFLLLALWPAARRILPRPGLWMLRLKEFLAFPMYGAAAWLAWVLAQEAGANGLAILLGAMVAVAFSAWAWNATRRAETRARRAGGATLALAVIVLALSSFAFLASSPPASRTAGPGQEAYSAARLAALRAENRPVFIDATAAWCITCLVNEQAVLSRTDVQSAFAAHHVAMLVADWTNRDAGVTALLEAQGRSGVPLYLYYAPGAVGAPVILPQILTASGVLAVIGAS